MTTASVASHGGARGRRPKLTAKKTEMALASLNDCQKHADYAHVDPLLADLRTDEPDELLWL